MNGARRIAGALAGIAVAAAAVTGAAAVTAAPGSSASVPVDPGPVATTHAQAAGYAEEHPGTAPARSNDFGCVPSPEHPRPVVLAHGTDSNSYSDWAAVAPMLADAGWCVFALDYGKADGADEYGTGDIRVSAAQLGAFVERVRAGTGATRSTSSATRRVRPSRGTTSTGWAARPSWTAGWGVASPSYGGTFYGLGAAVVAAPGATGAVEDFFSVALAQQLQGSELLTELNTPVDTVPGVRYTTIGSRVDEVIQPATNVALRGPGAVNLMIQDLCPPDQTGHFNMVYDPFSLTVIRHALDPERYVPGECVPVRLGTGIPELIIESNS